MCQWKNLGKLTAEEKNSLIIWLLNYVTTFSAEWGNLPYTYGEHCFFGSFPLQQILNIQTLYFELCINYNVMTDRP